MNLLTIPAAILAFLAVAVAAGGASVWYKKGQGESQISTSESIISMQKDENALQARKIIALQAQLDLANDNIERILKNGNSDRSRTKK